MSYPLMQMLRQCASQDIRIAYPPITTLDSDLDSSNFGPYRDVVSKVTRQADFNKPPVQMTVKPNGGGASVTELESKSASLQDQSARIKTDHVRKVSVEQAVKECTCRSCNRLISQGELRIKVSYPSVSVQFLERVGNPSFFMHPACFRSRPVDYIKVGPHPWKTWTSVDKFAVKQSEVTGLTQFPDAKQYFQLNAQVHQPAVQIPTAKAEAAATAHAPRKRKAGDEAEINHNIAAAVPVCTATKPTAAAASRPPDSNVKRPRIHVTMQVPSYSYLLEECGGDEKEARMQHTILQNAAAEREIASPPQQQLQQKQKQHLPSSAHSAKSEPQATRASRQVVCKNPTVEPGAPSAVVFERSSLQSDSKNSDCGDSDEGDSDAASEVAEPELQWSKPGQVSQTVGVSVSVLRRWANAGEVQTIVSDGGHRLFNLDSVRKHIETHASNAERIKEGQKAKLENAEVIFIRLSTCNSTPSPIAVTESLLQKSIKSCASSPPSSAKQALQVDDQTNLRERAAKLKQHIAALHPAPTKLIIELPEVALTDLNQRPGLNRLCSYIVKRQCNRLVLQDSKDITASPAAYAMFEWLCGKHGVTIVICPTLYNSV